MKRKKLLVLTMIMTLLFAACQANPTDLPTESPTNFVEKDTEPTSTPEPTATLQPTATPTPTATLQPTSTPVPTATPEPTATPIPHEHSYTEKVVAPTYTEDGYTVYTCDCGDNYVADEVSKLEYSYTELFATKYAKSNVNVRNLPSTDGDKVGSLSQGEKVIITGKCKETGWYRIEFNNGVAYVSDDYLTDKNPKPTATPVPEKQVYTVETLPVKLFEPIRVKDMVIAMYNCPPLVKETEMVRNKIINMLWDEYGPEGRIQQAVKSSHYTDYVVSINGVEYEVFYYVIEFVPDKPLGSDGPSFVGLKETSANRNGAARKDVAILDVNGKVIDILKKGEKVTITGTVFVSAEHQLYIIINFNGQKAYLSKNDVEQYDNSGAPMYTTEWYKYWNGKTYAKYKQSDYRQLIYVYDEITSESLEIPDDYVFGEKEVVFPNGNRYDGFYQ